jgi:hypothetical protein
MALNSGDIYSSSALCLLTSSFTKIFIPFVTLRADNRIDFFKAVDAREKPRSVYIIFSAALRERSDTLSGSKGSDTCLQISIECQSECAQNNKYALPKKDAIRVYSFTRRPRKGRREKCDPNGIIYGNSESSCTPPPTSTSQTQQRARRHWLTPADGNECALAAFSNCT